MWRLCRLGGQKIQLTEGVVLLFELVLSDRHSVERYLEVPFASEIQKYLEWMDAQGYQRATLRHRFLDAVAFCRFVQGRGAATLGDSAALVSAFVSGRVDETARRGRTRDRIRLESELEGSLRLFLRFLVGTEMVIPIGGASEPEFLFQSTLNGFLSFLRTERALAEPTIEGYASYARRFLIYAESVGILELKGLDHSVIHRWLEVASTTVGRRGLNMVCCAVRSLLRYLRMEGCPLAPAVEAFRGPRIYRYEHLPRFMTADEVRRVLEAIDRSTPQGLRDYAVLLLLATYGLRAAEVAKLKFDDIDWAGGCLRLRGRKSGRSDVLPLSQPVGEALLEYLQKARPACRLRHVFLTLRAPVGPLRRGAVSGLAGAALLAAKVCLPRLGAHALRHTCAHELLQAGFSYKTIGDYLGHASVSSTSVYLKVDLEGLLEVALNDGEELL